MKENTRMQEQQKIHQKRERMIKEAMKYGLNSKEVLQRSKELDTLILEYMKKHNR